MIFLRWIKRLGRQDFAHDRFRKLARLAELFFRAFGRLLLVVVTVKDRGLITKSDIVELTVGLRRVDVPPENIEQLLIGNLARIVSHFDRLPMFGAMRGDFFVGRVLSASARGADDRFDNSLGVIVRRLHAPKTNSGKD